MEKSEKPTKQKLRKAKERGEVAKSSELAFALLFFGGVLLLWGLHTLLNDRLKAVFYNLWKTPSLDSVFSRAFTPILLPMTITLLGLVVIAIAAHLLQTGWIWSWKRKKGKPSRRFFFPIIKWGVIAAVGYAVLHAVQPTRRLIFGSPEQQEAFLFNKLLFLALVVSAILVLLGLGDFIYQKWRFQKQMQMTPQEVKEERRETEGDPELKSRMRERK